jgi:hypothetical protein
MGALRACMTSISCAIASRRSLSVNGRRFGARSPVASTGCADVIGSQAMN